MGIEADFENLTMAGSDYRLLHVYAYFEEKGLRVERRQGRRARRKVVTPLAERPEVAYLTGVGHGTLVTFEGYKDEAIFRMGEYPPDVADGKITHFLSCQTAALLGPDFVEQGCRAYFGYENPFVLSPDHSRPFFECDSEIDRAFADGLTADEVYDRAYELFTYRIAELRSQGKLSVAARLEFNRDGLRAPAIGEEWGDPNAALHQVRSRAGRT